MYAEHMILVNIPNAVQHADKALNEMTKNEIQEMVIDYATKGTECFYDAVFDNRSLLADEPALLIMLYSGMRPGELLNIKAENVDMIHHEISGAATKTRESKKNPICFSTAVSGIITDYILGDKNQFATVEMETLRNQVDSLFNKLGMKHHELSACRTTFATFFSENETDEEPLRRLMRHTDIKTTRDNYDKSSTKAAHVALEQLHGIYTQTLEERIEEYDRQIAELEKAKNSLRKEKTAL